MPKSFFAAVGHDGLRLFSADGSTWENKQTGKEGETYRGVAFGNGKCVAVGTYGGGNIFAVTVDRLTWKNTSQDGKYSRYVRGFGFGNGEFICLGGDPGSVGLSRPFIVVSKTGETWTEPLEIAGKNILRRFAYGAGLFVGVGDRGRRAVSKDAREWKEAPEVKAIDTLVDVAFGNGVFVGVGLHGLRMASTDGVTWTERQTGEEGEHLNSVVWAKDKFVAVGSGATYLSSDGRKWERQANENAPTVVTYGNGKFVGASWKGRLLLSEDGVKWKETLKSPLHIEAVAWGELE